MGANTFTHFTGKKKPFRTQKRKKKPKQKRVHKNKYKSEQKNKKTKGVHHDRRHFQSARAENHRS